MPKKPAAININLVPKDPFFNSTIGRILQWALSAGRYIVIFTELVVIISFAARFTLDRQNNDLNSSIEEKKNIIESYGDLENNFRLAQTKIEKISALEKDSNILAVFENLTKVTPRDVTLSQLSIAPTTVTITGKTLSQSSFNLLVTNLQLSPQFTNISVSKVESGERNTPGFNFSISAKTKETQQTTVNKKVTEEKVDLLDRTGDL